MLPILNPPLSQPPHTIPLGLPSAPAPSIQHRALNLDCHLCRVINILRYELDLIRYLSSDSYAQLEEQPKW